MPRHRHATLSAAGTLAALATACLLATGRAGGARRVVPAPPHPAPGRPGLDPVRHRRGRQAGCVRSRHGTAGDGGRRPGGRPAVAVSDRGEGHWTRRKKKRSARAGLREGGGGARYGHASAGRRCPGAARPLQAGLLCAWRPVGWESEERACAWACVSQECVLRNAAWGSRRGSGAAVPLFAPRPLSLLLAPWAVVRSGGGAAI